MLTTLLYAENKFDIEGKKTRAERAREIFSKVFNPLIRVKGE